MTKKQLTLNGFDADLIAADMADTNRFRIAAGQLAMLEEMLKSPDVPITIDAVTDDLHGAFPDGGKWRGQIVKGLHDDGVILGVDVVKSTRPPRHSGYIGKWRLHDQKKAKKLRRDLRDAVSVLADRGSDPAEKKRPAVTPPGESEGA